MLPLSLSWLTAVLPLFSRVFFGPLPSWLCTLYALSFYVRLLLTLMAFLSMQVIRILYFTAWRNVGDLNDGLILCIYHVVAWALALFFAGCLYITDTYKTLRYDRYAANR